MSVRSSAETTAERRREMVTAGAERDEDGETSKRHLLAQRVARGDEKARGSKGA